MSCDKSIACKDTIFQVVSLVSPSIFLKYADSYETFWKILCIHILVHVNLWIVVSAPPDGGQFKTLSKGVR